MSDLTAEKKLRRYNNDGGRLVESGDGELYIVCEAHAFYQDRIAALERELSNVRQAFNEAGYLGDDLVVGVKNLRALFDSARSHEPKDEGTHALPPLPKRDAAIFEEDFWSANSMLVYARVAVNSDRNRRQSLETKDYRECVCDERYEGHQRDCPLSKNTEGQA